MKNAEIGHICRTCLITNVEMSPLVETHLIKLLEEVLAVQFTTSLFKSRMICTNCRRILNEFDVFKRKCTEIEAYVGKFANEHNDLLKSEITFEDVTAFDVDDVKDVKYDVDERLANGDDDGNASDCASSCKRASTTRGPKKTLKLMRDIPWYSCHLCEQKFNILISLRRHVKEHFHERKCAWCRKDFESYASLVKHYAQHADVHADYECTACASKCYTKMELDFHNGITHVLPSCPYCGKTFSSALKLALKSRERHLLAMHNIKIVKSTSDVTMDEFPCGECVDVRFATSDELNRHMSRKHHECETSVLCVTCTERFYTSEQLSAHYLSEHVTRDFRCWHEACAKKHGSLNALKRHLHNKHATSKHPTKPEKSERLGGKALCTICGKTVQHIDSHNQNVHVKPKKIRCLLCLEPFDTWKQLVTHRRATHAEVNPARTHQCDICLRWYPGQKNLYHHKKNLHNNTRPFNCTICSSTFKKARHLRLHMRQHTDERPYQCSFCDMKFRQTNTLNNHELIHKQEKPHRCEYCGVNFRQRIALTGHVASQHPGMKASVVRKHGAE